MLYEVHWAHKNAHLCFLKSSLNYRRGDKSCIQILLGGKVQSMLMMVQLQWRCGERKEAKMLHLWAKYQVQRYHVKWNKLITEWEILHHIQIWLGEEHHQSYLRLEEIKPCAQSHQQVDQSQHMNCIQIHNVFSYNILHLLLWKLRETSEKFTLKLNLKEWIRSLSELERKVSHWLFCCLCDLH